MMMVEQDVFLVLGPTRKIRAERAAIVSTKKWTWARLASGRRCLLGATAFFTRKSAEARKLGLLRKVASSAAMARMWQTRGLYDRAAKQLREYETSGRLN